MTHPMPCEIGADVLHAAVSTDVDAVLRTLRMDLVRAVEVARARDSETAVLAREAAGRIQCAADGVPPPYASTVVLFGMLHALMAFESASPAAVTSSSA